MIDDLMARVHSAGGSVMEDVRGKVFIEFSIDALSKLVHGIDEEHRKAGDEQLQNLAKEWMNVSLRQLQKIESLQTRRFSCPICAGEMVEQS